MGAIDSTEAGNGFEATSRRLAASAAHPETVFPPPWAPPEALPDQLDGCHGNAHHSPAAFRALREKGIDTRGIGRRTSAPGYSLTTLWAVVTDMILTGRCPIVQAPRAEATHEVAGPKIQVSPTTGAAGGWMDRVPWRRPKAASSRSSPPHSIPLRVLRFPLVLVPGTRLRRRVDRSRQFSDDPLGRAATLPAAPFRAR